MHIGILVSRIRVEERLLIDELARRGVDATVFDVREHVFDIHSEDSIPRFDAVLDRCISQTQALAAVHLFEARGVPCINPSSVIETCGDKLSTSLALARAGVPTPRVRVALDAESALAAVESLGYPAVLKPTTGSWGRLLARVNDRDSAEAIIEHKATLGSVQHSVFYVQEHIAKPGRDIRVFMIGDEPICAIERRSEHWITNTARGGQAARFEITPDVVDLCRRASRAVGGGVLAIDLLECPRSGLLVSEVNHTMEFRNSIEPTGVNIPARIIDHVLEVAAGQKTFVASLPARRDSDGSTLTHSLRSGLVQNARDRSAPVITEATS